MGDLTRHIRESNLVENIDDRTASAVGVAAWAWLIQQPYLTEEVVCMLHRITTAAQRDLPDEARGAWRTVGVSVGGHWCPPWPKVPELMAGWLDRWRNPYRHAPGTGDVEDLRAVARQSHVEFERIHPFVDGNGRTGRLLLWNVERAVGLTPTLISAATKHADYYPWFEKTSSDG